VQPRNKERNVSIPVDSTGNVLKLSTDMRTASAGFVRSEWGKVISSRLQHVNIIIPILIVYIFLAIYRIGNQSMWVDEVVSVQVASDESFFSPVIWFRQSPLYFALLHLWVQLGTSETILRFLSVFFGGVAVCLTYMLSVRLFNQRVAWIATTILATSPFLIWYSQEVRYITLMIVTSLFSMYAFHRALASNRRGWWVSYCCSLIVATAAFVSNMLLPLVQGLFVLFSPSRRYLFRKVFICQFVFFAVFIWWGNGGHLDRIGGRWEKLFNHVTLSSEKVASLQVTERLSSGGDRDFELAAVPYTFFTFSTGFSMGPSVRELQVSRSITTLRPFAPLLVTLAVLFGSLFILGMIALWREQNTGIFLILWLALPLIGCSVISALTDMTYNVRYVSMALPAYIVILSAGIVSFRRPVVQMALLTSVLLVNMVSVSNYYFDPRYARDDARSAARYLQSATGSQDLILVVGNTGALRYYYKGNAPIVSWDKKADGDRRLIRQRLTELARHHERLWLLEIRRWEKDRTGNVKAALEKLYSGLQQQHFPGVEIYAYDL